MTAEVLTRLVMDRLATILAELPGLVEICVRAPITRDVVYLFLEAEIPRQRAEADGAYGNVPFTAARAEYCFDMDEWDNDVPEQARAAVCRAVDGLVANLIRIRTAAEIAGDGRGRYKGDA